MNDNDFLLLKAITAIKEYIDNGSANKEVAEELLGKVEKVLAEERMRLCEIIDEDKEQ
jgi:hypothetical protein